MIYNFDQVIEQRGTDSAKWQQYDDDVLPLWVADMDFRSPEPVIRALHQRAEHGIFGYSRPPSMLAEVICERMYRLHNWSVTPEQILFLPGLVCGLNVVCRAIGAAGDGVLVQTPVYPPFLTAPGNQDKTLEVAQLAATTNGQTLAYEVDYDAFEAAITPRTRLFILCNPHNPIGRGYSRQELACMAEICNLHAPRFDYLL
jgi:cystathionine beta-lyase